MVARKNVSNAIFMLLFGSVFSSLAMHNGVQESRRRYEMPLTEAYIHRLADYLRSDEALNQFREMVLLISQVLPIDFRIPSQPLIWSIVSRLIG